MDMKFTDKYNMPILKPVHVLSGPVEIIGFNYAKSGKEYHKAVHFYLEDYMINSAWNSPIRYIDVLSKYKMVFTPDFSLYRDMPYPLQIYNHYRKQWLGAYWQSHGITVVPTVCWSTEDSFDFCFDGIPTESAVTVSTLGCMHDHKARDLFKRGYAAMIDTLNPSQILLYGSSKMELPGNIVHLGDRRFGTKR